MITYSYLYITRRGKEDMEYKRHIPSEFHKYTRYTFSKHVTADMLQTNTPGLVLQILVIILWSCDS
jgi:hypothetical protein